MENVIHKRELFKYLRDHFALDWYGIHGAGHWARVWKNGRMIAQAEGARLDVVWLFSFLHDHKRKCDGEDQYHGWDAVVNAAENLRDRFFIIDEAGWNLLRDAMNLHSHGFSGKAFDITIQTCWDADRLDLGRVGRSPDPKYLSTETAKNPDFLRAAFKRSLGGFLK